MYDRRLVGVAQHHWPPFSLISPSTLDVIMAGYALVDKISITALRLAADEIIAIKKVAQRWLNMFSAD